eukprot:GSChrysophyteH2.ASY1.ANO1.1310.1 assembled CDS
MPHLTVPYAVCTSVLKARQGAVISLCTRSAMASFGLCGILAAALALCCACATAPTAASRRPQVILHILADDLGWAELGYHNEEARIAGDVVTPNIDRLASEGLELDRFYTEKICSPSRSSLLSGRHGIHVNQQNVYPEVHNPEDPYGGYQGIPLNMTTFAQGLQEAGYKTSLVGKWDVGMATDRHSPSARGFDTWLGYWHHSNDYWTMNQEQCNKHDVKDLWQINVATGDNGPATNKINYIQCVYEESIFVEEVKAILRNHATSIEEETPLFLFYSMHLVHMPLEPLDAARKKFAHIHDSARRDMHAMVHTMDTYLGEIEQTLRETNLWNDTLLVFHSDNGGEIMTDQFEGGIRSNAFVTGGFLPQNMRGKKTGALMSVADWYSTYLHAAGVSDADVVDTVAEEAGLPALDSANCWPVILGEQESCRDEIAIGDTTLLKGTFKILLGPENKEYHVGQDVLTGPFFPNRTEVLIPELHPRVCGRTPGTGCLFDIFADPSESVNLAESHSELFMQMLERVDAIQSTVYSPHRGHRVAAACDKAEENGWFWGPFL